MTELLYDKLVVKKIVSQADDMRPTFGSRLKTLFMEGGKHTIPVV